MGKQAVSGISGVLGGLITQPSSASRSDSLSVVAPIVEQTEAIAESPVSRLPKQRSARRGRPPGRTTGSAEAKTKVTLRVDARLMDDYRDWSWTARCQLGELVERALEHYRSVRR